MKIKILLLFFLLCIRISGQHSANLDLAAELSRLEKLGLASDHPEILKIKARIDAGNDKQVGKSEPRNYSSKSINDFSTVIFNESIKSIGILISTPLLANKENEELNIKKLYIILSEISFRKRIIAFYPSKKGILVILSPDEAPGFVESIKKQNIDYAIQVGDPSQLYKVNCK